MPKSSVKKFKHGQTGRRCVARKRRHSSSSDEMVASCRQASKRWKRATNNLEPDILQDMGVSLLDDDLQSEEGKLEGDEISDLSEICELDNQTDGENLSPIEKSSTRREHLKYLNRNEKARSSDEDITDMRDICELENQVDSDNLSCCPTEKSNSKRQPLKYLNHNDIALQQKACGASKCDGTVQQNSGSECADSDNEGSQSSLKLEKLKPVNCKIKNSQIIYQNMVTVVEKKTCDEKRCEDVRKNYRKCYDHSASDDGDAFFLKKLRHKSVEPIGPDIFTSLPDELVLGVFRWLPRKNLVSCSMVCKRFHRLAADDSLWIRCDLSSKSLPGNCLRHIIGRGCRILRLAQTALCDPIYVPDPGLPLTCKLQYLDMSMTALSPSGLASLLGLCSQLKKLSLEKCQLNNDCTKAIAGNKDLEVLNLAMTTGLSAMGMHTLLSNCRKIQALNLSWAGISSGCLDVLAWKIPSRVERLNISGCKETLTNEHVIEILHRCEDMLELDVSDCNNINDILVNFITKYVDKMEHLSLSRCYSLDINCLSSLGHVESLMFLDVFGLMVENEINDLKGRLMSKNVALNQFIFSSVARPTVGLRRTSIWGLRVRD